MQEQTVAAGLQVGSLEEFSECLPAGSATDCQAGLTLSHMKAWQALAHSAEYAAWVFEYALFSLQCSALYS